MSVWIRSSRTFLRSRRTRWSRNSRNSWSSCRISPSRPSVLSPSLLNHATRLLRLFRPSALPPLGPLTHPCFYVEGRTALSIDRGPFPTARAYFLACAERERAATRALFTQGAPAGAEYQALLAETQAIVERAVTLLIELVRRCEGLDSADPELARYALDLHELGLKNIIVAPDDPTRIVRSAFLLPQVFFPLLFSLPP